MTTITITLPDDLAKQAKAKGLLSSTALTRLIGEAIHAEDFDPRLRGAVNPLAFKRGRIVGDVVSPLGIAWEASS
jgi:post-segregation antitoxin (ccd killing protein)